jgi:hypothetical protein
MGACGGSAHARDHCRGVWWRCMSGIRVALDRRIVRGPPHGAQSQLIGEFDSLWERRMAAGYIDRGTKEDDT